MFPQHSTRGFYPPLCPPFLVLLPRLHPLLSHVWSQLRPQSGARRTFRHMDLPFVYHQLDRGVTEEGGLAYDWLWFTHPKNDWL